MELLHAAMAGVAPGVLLSTTKEFAEGIMEFIRDGNETKTPAKVGRKCEACAAPSNKHCARCKTVTYCSRACQLSHWKEGGHKKKCLWVASVHRIHDASAQFGAY